MDRRIKERLVGATILVALIVLIVPELLSGPKRPAPPPLSVNLPASTRTVSVDLATSKATAAPQPSDLAPSAAAPPAGAGAPDNAALSSAAPGTGDTSLGAPSDAPARADQSPTHTADAPSAPPVVPPIVTTLRAQGAAAPALETQPSSPKLPLETVKSAASSDADSRAHHGWAVQLGSFANKANADKLARQLKAPGAPVYLISSGSGPALRYKVRMGPLPDRSAAERAVVKLKGAGHNATIVAPAS
jgi:DedD protein